MMEVILRAQALEGKRAREENIYTPLFLDYLISQTPCYQLL